MHQINIKNSRNWFKFKYFHCWVNIDFLELLQFFKMVSLFLSTDRQQRKCFTFLNFTTFLEGIGNNGNL